MSSLETRKIEPLSGTTVTLGAAGDAVTVPTGATVKSNSLKDAGGNILWTSDGSGTLSGGAINQFKGGLQFISSQTAASSSVVNFTTGIDSTYSEYIFYLVNIHPGTDRAHLRFQVSTDGGTTYATMVTSVGRIGYHKEDNSGGPAGGDLWTNDAQVTTFMTLATELDADNDSSLSGELHLYAPSSTTFVKHYMTRCGLPFDGGAMYAGSFEQAGYFNTTSAVNAISFKMSSGNIDLGTIYMYGVP